MMVKLALRALSANLLRTSLSVLGIVIGVSSVIALMAIGEGQRRDVMAIFERLGANRVTVIPRRGQRGGVTRRDFTPIRLEMADLVALQTQSMTIKDISPHSDLGTAHAKYLNNNMPVEVVGITPSYFSVENYTLKEGREISEEDVVSASRVAVIGGTVADELFGTKSPLGEEIKINGKMFEIIGVFEEKGAFGWFNPDEQVALPMTTVQKRMSGTKYIDYFTLTTWNVESTTEAEEESLQILGRRHNVAFGTEDDYFRIYNTGEWQAERERSSKVINTFLLIVSAITLLIGGIGIMNIMLVTVTERTREIGLRKALGARRSTILFQFLIEAMLICLGGAGAGIALGIGITKLVARLPADVDFPDPVVLPEYIFLAVGISVAVGIIFGIWPAFRASRLKPIEALRYE